MTLDIDAGHQHWNVDLLERAMSEEESGYLFVSGCAEEQADLYPKFGSIILLTAPRQTMVNRILLRSGNTFGQKPEEMTLLMAMFDRLSI